MHCVDVGSQQSRGQHSTSYQSSDNCPIARYTNKNRTGNAPESVSTSVSSSPCSRSKDGRCPELRSYLVRRWLDALWPQQKIER
jgi:hypothetical protein